ncbi:hypothetical protein [Sandarakinorhabdus oryzae]|uniref:hypothetical protein n=1 Tax=Sandarakinorhabdus oryzae TaxID=2675220 RepID=UPI0012E0F0C5|nr:hypothetical protein [Sandarakinorhabdus oryzae]
MGFDLAKALHKKAEVETARLQAFTFQQRARAISLIAKDHGLNPAAVAGALAVCPDAELIDRLAAAIGLAPAATAAAFTQALATARQHLVAEQGDPTPHRLA